MRPICVKCEIEIRPEKNGVFLFEWAFEIGLYKIWHADLWKCPLCKMEVIHGFASHPIAEHWQEGFDEKANRIRSSGETIINNYEYRDGVVLRQT